MSRRNLNDRLNRLEAHTRPNPQEEARRERVIRALDWMLELRRQGRPRGAPLSDITPKNDEERENLVILEALHQRARELGMLPPPDSSVK
jgi:hypothetical protein